MINKFHGDRFCYHKDDFYVCIKEHISSNKFKPRYWELTEKPIESDIIHTYDDAYEMIYKGDYIGLNGLSPMNWSSGRLYLPYETPKFTILANRVPHGIINGELEAKRYCKKHNVFTGVSITGIREMIGKSSVKWKYRPYSEKYDKDIKVLGPGE